MARVEEVSVFLALLQKRFSVGGFCGPLRWGGYRVRIARVQGGPGSVSINQSRVSAMGIMFSDLSRSNLNLSRQAFTLGRSSTIAEFRVRALKKTYLDVLSSDLIAYRGKDRKGLPPILFNPCSAPATPVQTPRISCTLRWTSPRVSLSSRKGA
jgi:hypothetical protein